MRPPILPVEDLEASIVRLTKAETDAPPLTFPEVSVNYVPGRALLFSAIFHQLVVLLILLLSFTLSRTYLPGSRAFNGTIKLSDASGVIYLPVLGGGDEGNGHEGGSPGAASKASSPAPSRSSKGRAYPGPQPILSDPENPTNQQQTIIHPAAENSKLLEQFVPLPNMVKIAKPKLQLPGDLLAAKPELPEFRPEVKPEPTQPPVENPKLALPSAPPSAPIRPAVEKARHPAADKVVEPPKLSQEQTQGTDDQALVLLSPTPTLPQNSPQIPLGEARGRFGVSPTTNLAPQATPGSKIEGSPDAAAIGKTNVALGDAAGETAVGAGAGGGKADAGGGGVGNGIGAEKGSGKGGTGTESARGSAIGAGMGTGPGSTSASGAGAGNATGKGGLLGLTIQGGTLKHDSGNNGSKGSANGSESSREINISLERQPPQTAYGLTITSTADSGGGLPDLGVFVDEKVYTVYLDVKATPSGHAASWTLQYAWLRSASEGSQDTGNPNHEGLTPPFPLTREIPTLNPELVRTYLRYVIVVYAVMDERGQLQRMSVKQSPDKRLSGPILSALSQWVFQPAQLNGVAVPLKVLIGIPLIP